MLIALFNLTVKSVLSRKLVFSLLVVSIALSSMLLIGVQKIKHSAKESFSHSISGTDLIVGSRSGDIQLLLYTVFRQGQAVANMSWDSVTAIQSFPEVDWVVPVSLGDSHRGYPVLATHLDYFEYYRYGRKQSLLLRQGRLFSSPFDVVLGYEVAQKLQYTLGKRLYLAHGIAKGNLPVHKQYLFTVVGILEPTGTPVDKTVHIGLGGMTALHLSPQKSKSLPFHSDDLLNEALQPDSVTGCLVGLKSKLAIFSIKNRITQWSKEPLMAIIPGVTLSRLWGSIRTIDRAFFIITVLVMVIALMGLLVSLFISLQQRKRELIILRTMGAHPSQLVLMLVFESLLVSVSGVVLGLGLIVGVGTWLTPLLESRWGLILSLTTLSVTELYFAIAIIILSVLISLIPGIIVYRKGSNYGILSI